VWHEIRETTINEESAACEAGAGISARRVLLCSKTSTLPPCPTQNRRRWTVIKKEWETFFDLLDKIVNGPGSWQDKIDEVQIQAKANGSELSLDEFAEWFQGDHS
jgi:hypothetical protein